MYRPVAASFVVKSIVSPHCRRVVSSVIWSLVASRRLVHNILRLVLLSRSSCVSSPFDVNAFFPL